MDAVELDLFTRIEDRVTHLGDLLGVNLFDQLGRDRLDTCAADRVAQLRDDDPETATRAANAIGGLVNLNDPTDAASPLGIAIASHGRFEGKLLRQSEAAVLLGVSRQRVWDLIREGRLQTVGDDLGHIPLSSTRSKERGKERGPRVTRDSIARELARRNEKPLHVVERLKPNGKGTGEYMDDLGLWVPLRHARKFPTLKDARRVATAGPGKSFARGITIRRTEES